MVDGSQLACEDQVLLQAIRRVQFAAPHSVTRTIHRVFGFGGNGVSRSVRLPVPVGV